METSVSRHAVDRDQLASDLKVLAYGNRLKLFEILDEPRTADQIELPPSEGRADRVDGSTITRQAVHNHLKRLGQRDLIQVGTTRGPDGRSRQTYMANYARLFAIVEDLRQLLAPADEEPIRLFETVEVDGPPSKDGDTDGPRLVQVAGADEGRVFPLRNRDRDPPRGWIIGRGRSVQIRVPHDPYVSRENSEIIPVSGGYELRDVRSSKNGTFLNWDRLETGGTRPVETGDVVGVGRTRLVFRRS